MAAGPLTAFLDTNVIVRLLTDDPPAAGRRARRFLRDAEELLLPDLIVAEIVHVLMSVYKAPREVVADRLRAVVGFDRIHTVDPDLLLRALEVYESHRIGFPDAYLVASAEASGVGRIASFDRGIDRVGTVERVEPG